MYLAIYITQIQYVANDTLIKTLTHAYNAVINNIVRFLILVIFKGKLYIF